MSLQVDGVWKGGIWAATVWADGVWHEGAPSPPVFSGTIPDITVGENTGSHVYQLGGYFTGATSYSIAPAVETGWAFDTVTGDLTIDTDDAAVFGPYVVTGTNAGGSDDSNGFTVTVTPAPVQSSQPSGGWLTFLNTYEQQLARRRQDAKRRRELEEETERIEDATDREIAQLLRVQEAKDERRSELQTLSESARQAADIEAARAYSDAVAEAYARVLAEGNLTAAIALDLELQKAREEEEALLMQMLLLTLE